MSAKVIQQNLARVRKLPKRPSSLSQINAYTDQSLMNLTYETMSDSDYAKSKAAVIEMMETYRAIKQA